AAGSATSGRRTLDMEAVSGPLETLTKTGAIIGTPAYLPPEILEGEAPDTRGDQFSFCVTAFEALFGRRPFEGKSLHDLVGSAHAGDITVGPHDRRVPRSLRRLLVRGLAANPSERFASMDVLVAKLEAELSRPRRWAIGATTFVGVSTLVAVAWPSPTTVCTGAGDQWSQTWSPDERQAVATAMLATGAPGVDHTHERVTTLLDDYGQRWTTTHREVCRATHERKEQSTTVLDRRMRCLEGHRTHADALVQSLLTIDAEGVPLAVMAAQRLPQIDDCKGGDTRHRPLPDDPDTRTRVQQLRAALSQARVLEQLGRHETARDRFDEIRGEADALGYRPLMVDVRMSQTEGLPPTPQSRDAYYEALHLAEVEAYTDAQRQAWTALAQCHVYLGEYEASRRAAEHANAFIERTGNRPPDRAQLLDARAFAHLEQSQFPEAVALMEEAVAVLRTHDPAHPELGSMYGSLGTIYTLVERNEDAKVAYEQAYEIRRRTLGPQHATVANAMMNLGRVTARLDDLPGSNAWYRRALAVYEEVGAQTTTASIFALNNLGQNYGDQGRYDEARTAVERAITMQIANVGPEHRYLVRMRRGLASILLDAGQIDDAVAECERALAVAQATFGDPHDETASTQRRLGRILLETDDRSRAIRLLEQALTGHQRPGIPPLHLAITQYWLFIALRDDPSAQARAQVLATAAIPALAQGEARDRERATELRAWIANH
ncbi:MAG: tetratricopeptide repeat protein, partial [Deltaproteobacteria bacterium]|nr:tetratricopeptide repeat protein [Deltaproteobacteria bacterium]